METENIYQVIKKLVGEIRPVGASHIDEDRFKNLRTMTALIDKLIMDVEEVNAENHDRYEHSMKKAASHSKDFIQEIVREYRDVYNPDTI